MKKVIFVFLTVWVLQSTMFCPDTNAMVGNFYPTLSGGYAGATYAVELTGLTNPNVVWTLETYGASGTFYYWPSGGIGRVCDVSIYTTTPGTICIIAEVYDGSTLVRTETGYITYS